MANPVKRETKIQIYQGFHAIKPRKPFKNVIMNICNNIESTFIIKEDTNRHVSGPSCAKPCKK